MNTSSSLAHPPLPFKKGEVQGPDLSHVITLFHSPGDKARIKRIEGAVCSLDSADVEKKLVELHDEFQAHRDIDVIWRDHFIRVESCLPVGVKSIDLSDAKKLLIGASFTKECSIEAAALFNPSIVLHPDQKDTPKGSARFVMSLRATSEGHVSSIVFRTGIIDEEGNVAFDEREKCLETARISATTFYNRLLFERKLHEVGVSDEVVSHLFEKLSSEFCYNDFAERVRELESEDYFRSRPDDLERIKDLGLSDYVQPNYKIAFPAEYPLSGRVIFPHADFEKKGMEDVRFVRFLEDDGEAAYYATYTAYDGHDITPQLISTKDFTTFEIHSLTGKASKNKGMALFPEKINGEYYMLGRQDNENITLMHSKDLHNWDASKILHAPAQLWEIFQVGNCGSPIKTEDGWLVITHGVGPMRKYSIGAILLDLKDPSKVIGEIKEPILSAEGKDRHGYVPNVAYSCGSMAHGDHLVLTHALSDTTYNVATFSIKQLLSYMEPPKDIANDQIAAVNHLAEKEIAQVRQ